MSWQAVVDEVERTARARRAFLPAGEIRGLERQAGDDYRAGAEMVERMEQFARGARDRALAALSSQPSAELGREALAAMAARADAYDRLGIDHVIACLDHAVSGAAARR
jgi:hypothetical protein